MPPEFVIDAVADSKLRQLSSDFSDAILSVASAVGARTRQAGKPVNIGVCEIESAARLLCEVMEGGINAGKFPADRSPALQQLREVCLAFAKDCQQHESATAGHCEPCEAGR